MLSLEAYSRLTDGVESALDEAEKAAMKDDRRYFIFRRGVKKIIATGCCGALVADTEVVFYISISEFQKLLEISDDVYYYMDNAW